MISIVLPAYNEVKKICVCVERVSGYFAQRGEPIELIIVDDGSSDATGQMVKEMARDMPHIRLLRHERNRGKGAALRTGIAASQGEYVLFLDVDLSVEPDAWPSFAQALEHGAKVVIGSRRIQGARVLKHQPRLREQLGRIFSWLTRTVLVDVSDTTCGFKAFRGESARELFALSHIDGWSFDAEILYLAKKRGDQIVEVPVVWSDDPETKVNVCRAMLSSLFDLLRIRWLHD